VSPPPPSSFARILIVFKTTFRERSFRERASFSPYIRFRSPRPLRVPPSSYQLIRTDTALPCHTEVKESFVSLFSSSESFELHLLPSPFLGPWFLSPPEPPTLYSRRPTSQSQKTQRVQRFADRARRGHSDHITYFFLCAFLPVETRSSSVSALALIRRVLFLYIIFVFSHRPLLPILPEGGNYRYSHCPF